MITWQDLESFIPQTLKNALLTDPETQAPDDKAIRDLLDEINAMVGDNTGPIVELFAKYFALQRLHERFGYLEQAKYYAERADQFYRMMKNTALIQNYSRPVVRSDPRAITDEELERW